MQDTLKKTTITKGAEFTDLVLLQLFYVACLPFNVNLTNQFWITCKIFPITTKYYGNFDLMR